MKTWLPTSFIYNCFYFLTDVISIVVSVCLVSIVDDIKSITKLCDVIAIIEYISLFGRWKMYYTRKQKMWLLVLLLPKSLSQKN